MQNPMPYPNKIKGDLLGNLNLKNVHTSIQKNEISGAITDISA